jgi:serine phosphatase RsbU (regulator of sigma subunit)
VEILTILPDTKDKVAALGLALEALHVCRSDPATYSDCAAAGRKFRRSVVATGISDPAFLEESRQFDSALDGIEATIVGNRIPRVLRPLAPWLFPGLWVFVCALVAGVLVILIHKRESKVYTQQIHGLKLAHSREVETIREECSAQLHQLCHSAQLEAARAALKQFAPPPPPLRRRNIQVAASFHQGSGVHGDVFNWYTSNDGDTWIYLVDVEGRGYLAAIKSTLIRRVLDSTLGTATDDDPQKVLSAVDRQFEDYGATGDLAATMNLIRVSTGRKLLQLANAGMPAPLIFRYGQAQAVPIQAAGVYVGSGYSHYKIEPALAVESIGIGDLIVAYSDGVIEARDRTGGPWGVAGLSSQVMRYRDAEIGEIATKIIEGATDHSGTEEATDDQCVVVIRIGSDTEARRETSAPTIGVARTSAGLAAEVEFTIVNSIDAMSGIHNTVRPEALEWAGQVLWNGDPGRLWQGLCEATVNSLRHGTGMGDRVHVKLRKEGSDAVVELQQPREWRDWDMSLGPERRALVEGATKLDLEMPQWGTFLMLWYSDSLEVLQQGRLIRMRFCPQWRREGKCLQALL